MDDTVSAATTQQHLEFVEGALLELQKFKNDNDMKRWVLSEQARNALLQQGQTLDRVVQEMKKRAAVVADELKEVETEVQRIDSLRMDWTRRMDTVKTSLEKDIATMIQEDAVEVLLPINESIDEAGKSA